MLKLFRYSFRAMGSPCEVHLYAAREAEARRVAEQAMADARRIEQRYSRYRPDSLLAAVNRAAEQGGALDVDDETAALLDYAAACYAQSGGLFDITSGVLRLAWDFQSGKLPEQAAIDALLPRIGWDKLDWRRPRLAFLAPGMQLDFGGIGKEYAADRAAALCMEQGIRHGLVDFGGDIRAIGPHPDGRAWDIGIQHPRTDGLMASMELRQGALASSGDYERCIEFGGRRYGHILNPMTGWPARGLMAASVAAPHCLVAGSACTIALLKGEDGPAWLEELGLPHVWMDEQGVMGGSLGAAG